MKTQRSGITSLCLNTINSHHVNWLDFFKKLLKGFGKKTKLHESMTKTVLTT